MDASYDVTVNGEPATIFCEVEYVYTSGPVYLVPRAYYTTPPEPGHADLLGFSDISIEVNGVVMRCGVEITETSLEQCLPSTWKVVGLPTDDQVVDAILEYESNRI